MSTHCIGHYHTMLEIAVMARLPRKKFRAFHSQSAKDTHPGMRPRHRVIVLLLTRLPNLAVGAKWHYQGCCMHLLSCLADLRPMIVIVRACTFAVPWEVRTE
jgi:hypothetical protein